MLTSHATVARAVEWLIVIKNQKSIVRSTAVTVQRKHSASKKEKTDKSSVWIAILVVFLTTVRRDFRRKELHVRDAAAGKARPPTNSTVVDKVTANGPRYLKARCSLVGCRRHPKT